MSEPSSGLPTPRPELVAAEALPRRLSVSPGGGGVARVVPVVPVPDETRVAPLAIARNAKAVARCLRRGAKAHDNVQLAAAPLAVQAPLIEKCVALTNAARAAPREALPPPRPSVGAPRPLARAPSAGPPDVAAMAGQLERTVRGLGQVRHELLAVWGGVARAPSSVMSPGSPARCPADLADADDAA